MKRISLSFLVAGSALLLFGLLTPWLASWLAPDISHPNFPLAVDEASFSIALYGIVDLLLGLAGICFSRPLDQISKPRTFLLVTGWSIAMSLAIHSTWSLLSCFITRPSRYPIRLPVSVGLLLAALIAQIWLFRSYCLTREDDPYPTCVTFEFGFAILYTLPQLIILIALDELLCIL